MSVSGRRRARLVPGSSPDGARSASSWRSRPAPSWRRRRPAMADSAATHRLSAPRSSPSIHRPRRSRCRSSVATRSSCCASIPGVEVDVMGYQNEPYLRFAADGTVYENQRSPATYINGSRYGGGTIPDECVGRRRARLGRGRRPGQRRVRLARPPRPPDAAGRPGRRGTGRSDPRRGAADRRRRHRGRTSGSRARGCPLRRDGRRCSARSCGVIVIVGAPAGADGDGCGDWCSSVPARSRPWSGGSGTHPSPSSTDPRPVWWLLPVLAVAFGAAAWVLGPTPGGHAAAAIAGLELAVWALDRRAGLTRAVLPTDAPYWLDRAVTVGAFVGGRRRRRRRDHRPVRSAPTPPLVRRPDAETS